MPTSTYGCSVNNILPGSILLPIDPKFCGCCYCGMFPPHSTHSRLLLVVSSSILPSSKTEMSMLQMVLIITIVSPTVLMAVGFLSSISNVWNPLLAPTTPFSGSSVGWFWLVAGIPSGLVMMKWNLDCSTGWLPSSQSLLQAVDQDSSWGKALNCGFRSSLLTTFAHPKWAQKSFLWKVNVFLGFLHATGKPLKVNRNLKNTAFFKWRSHLI